MSDDERVRTPPLSVDVAAWLASISIGDVAYIHGVAFQLMAMNQGVSERDLYEEFVRRATADPDANVVR